MSTGNVTEYNAEVTARLKSAKRAAELCRSAYAEGKYDKKMFKARRDYLNAEAELTGALRRRAGIR